MKLLKERMTNIQIEFHNNQLHIQEEQSSYQICFKELIDTLCLYLPIWMDINTQAYPCSWYTNLLLF